MMHDYYIYSMLGTYVPSELMPSEQPGLEQSSPEPEYTEAQMKQNHLITTLVALVLLLFNGAVLATAAVKFAQSRTTTPITQTQGQQQMAQWMADKSF